MYRFVEVCDNDDDNDNNNNNNNNRVGLIKRTE